MAEEEKSTPIKALQVLVSTTKEDGNNENATYDEIESIILIPDNNKDRIKSLLCEENKDLHIFVISIIGETRGGKSFFLNLMSKYLEFKGRNQDWTKGAIPNVFDWEGGDDSVTRGIWISPKIYKLPNENGEEVGILLLDNQGLFDGQQMEGVGIAMSGISTAMGYYQICNVCKSINTNDLQTIWCHLIPVESSENEICKTKLMFIVRDFVGYEGFGLEHGKQYIANKKTQGTLENKTYWKKFEEVFPVIQCLPLQHPGLKVTEETFRKSGTLEDVGESFLGEVHRFFEEIFTPTNLNFNLSSNILTGNEIYDILDKANNKRADNSLSFLNVHTELGNLQKKTRLLLEFESRLKCYENHLSELHKLKDDILQSSNEIFKGPSAGSSFKQLENEIVEKLNALIRNKISQNYKDSFERKDNITENHSIVWCSVIEGLNYLFGTSEDKKAAADRIITECAAFFYKELRNEIEQNFNTSCTSKNLEELEGFDDIFVSNQFQEKDDFKSSQCKALWLKEKEYLKQNTQDEYLKKVSSLTKMDMEWLQTCIQTQYEFFEAFTCSIDERNECHWSNIYTEESRDCLDESIFYAVYREPLISSEFSTDKLDKVKNIGAKIKSYSTYEPVRLSYIFVMFKNNNDSFCEPVFRVQNATGVLFIDTEGRVYENWESYKSDNNLPNCAYCFPLRGEYNKATGFQVAFGWSPEAYKVFLRALDKTGKAVAVGSTAVLAAATVTAAAPVVVTGAACASAIAGGYGVIRGVGKIKDKISHEQKVSGKDILDMGIDTVTVVTAGAANAIKVGKEVCYGVQSFFNLYNLVRGRDRDNFSLFTNVAMTYLLLFNSKSADAAIRTIMDSYNLVDVPEQDVLKAVVTKNSVESYEVHGDKQEIRQFLSAGLTSFVLNLLNTQDNILDTCLEQEGNFLRMASSAGLCLLQKSFETAENNDKKQFFNLLIELIHYVTGININSVSLRGYRNHQFFPVSEVLKQIDFRSIVKEGKDLFNYLDERTKEKLQVPLVKILEYVCGAADCSWSLQKFNEHLESNRAQIMNSIEDKA